MSRSQGQIAQIDWSNNDDRKHEFRLSFFSFAEKKLLERSMRQPFMDYRPQVTGKVLKDDSAVNVLQMVENNRNPVSLLSSCKSCKSRTP